MKKFFGKFLILICLMICCFASPNVAKADYSFDNTLIFTDYNDQVSFYADLTGISEFAINEKYISYAIDNYVYILNKTTKHTFTLPDNISLPSVDNLYMTKHYIFVVSGTDIYSYHMESRALSKIYIDATKTTILGGYIDYSVAEFTDSIVIAAITDSTFSAYFFNSDTMKYTSSYTNTALNNEITNTGYSLLNVASTATTAYIINNSAVADENSLWKVDYSNSNLCSRAMFTKPNIETLVPYTYTDAAMGTTRDYLIAIDTNNAINIHRTDITEYVGNEEYADDVITGNTTDSRFVVNDLSTPEDITISNGMVWVSDSGTKCIQSFDFAVVSGKATITGNEIVLAGECGEVGRFNRNSNIEYMNGTIVVSDANNRRVQIINDTITSYDKNILGTDVDQLDNLTQAYQVGNVIYFMSYTKLGKQNIFSYDITTDDLDLKAHNATKVLDSTISGTTIYMVASNGIFILNTANGLISPILNATFADDSHIAYITNDCIAITEGQNVSFYSVSGTHATKSNSVTISRNITDIVSSGRTLYILDNATKSIFSYTIDTQYNLADEKTLPYTNIDVDYYSITIDDKTGIIYVFDNKSCRIDRIINPTFNFVHNSGIYQVNNKNVSIYARPYYLNGIDTPNIIDKLDVNTRITVYSKTSINYGNIEYYIVDLGNNTYGYINRADLTYLSEVINYEVIHPNASIRAFDDREYINVYSEASFDSEIIATAPVDTRIYIQDYDSSNEFSFVRFYDKDQNLIEGYIANNLVDSDEISRAQVLALILVGCSIVLLIAILITIHVIKKRRLKKIDEE